MFRFSRDKRFFGRVSLFEFTTNTQILVGIVKESRPHATVEVFCAETMAAYELSQITFVTDEILTALEMRKAYKLKDLSVDIWNRTLSLDVIIRDHSDAQPFMTTISLDRRGDNKSLKFYGQAMEEELAEQITTALSKPDLWFSIGNGYSKPSAVNLALGLKFLRAKAS